MVPEIEGFCLWGGPSHGRLLVMIIADQIGIRHSSGVGWYELSASFQSPPARREQNRLRITTPRPIDPITTSPPTLFGMPAVGGGYLTERRGSSKTGGCLLHICTPRMMEGCHEGMDVTRGRLE